MTTRATIFPPLSTTAPKAGAPLRHVHDESTAQGDDGHGCRIPTFADMVMVLSP